MAPSYDRTPAAVLAEILHFSYTAATISRQITVTWVHRHPQFNRFFNFVVEEKKTSLINEINTI